MTKKILITSALPYANGPLHFGHIAGAYLPADVYARFERLRGNQVLFICGSDEYGVAIALSAEMAHRTPKEHIDHFHAINQHLFASLQIQFDHYSRTTCAEHAPLVQQVFTDLLANGYIEERETEQLFSAEEGKFLADRYVVGICPHCSFEKARGDECPACGASYEATDLKQPTSKVSGSPLTRKKTTHWFLLFDKFQEMLQKFLEEKKTSWKANVVHFAQSYIRDIHPRAITRDLSWGIPIPLPHTEKKVFYVWFDAPIGYISGTQEWANKRGKPEAWREFWCDPKTKYVQFMGKDNIPFHAVFFPAMLMGQNEPYKLVDDVVANEFYHLEGKKFSKSDGWTIDLDRFFQHFQADQIRYAIASNAPESSDSSFSWKDFQARCNSDLLGKFGNLANRVLVFAQHHTGGMIPKRQQLQEKDLHFLHDLDRLLGEIEEAYATYRVRHASQIMMEISQIGNVYFDSKMPWKEAKQGGSRPDMETTISLCMECLKRLAYVSFPLLPAASQQLWQLLGYQVPLSSVRWSEIGTYPLREGISLPTPSILYKKIEDHMIEQEIAALQPGNKPAEEGSRIYAPLKPEITLEDFAKVDLRVGVVLKAEKLPKSKKILQLEIDIGSEKRQIVSGISQHYAPEALIGKRIILVANLKPATIMGVESRGMLLAGSIDEALEIASIQHLPAGAVVK